MHPEPVPPAAPATAGSVDAARQRLAGIDALTTVEQVEAFDAVHRHLQDALASVEQELRAPANAGGEHQGRHPAR